MLPVILIGLPSEIIGLNALNTEYENFEKDMERALRFFNPECLEILPEEVRKNIRNELFDYEPEMGHRE